jgi:hypothetical protein
MITVVKIANGSTKGSKAKSHLADIKYTHLTRFRHFFHFGKNLDKESNANATFKNAFLKGLLSINSLHATPTNILQK